MARSPSVHAAECSPSPSSTTGSDPTRGTTSSSSHATCPAPASSRGAAHCITAPNAAADARTTAHPTRLTAVGDHPRRPSRRVSFARAGGPFTATPWQREEVVLAVRPSHPLAAEGTIRPDRLMGEPLVALSNRLKFRRQHDRWLKTAGVDADLSYQFDSIELVKRAVEAGAGVALLPEPTVRREVDLGTLSAVRVEGVEWTRPLSIVHRKKRPRSAAADAFVDLLLELADPAREQDRPATTERTPAADPPREPQPPAAVTT